MLEKKDNGAGIFDFTPLDKFVYFVPAIEEQLPVPQLWSNDFLGFLRQYCNEKAGATLDYPALGSDSTEINELVRRHRKTRLFEQLTCSSISRVLARFRMALDCLQ